MSASLRDRHILYATGALRATATGVVGVLLGVYLARLGIGEEPMGLIIAAGLAGTALAALVATFFGDRWGRRRILLVVSALVVVGTLGAALTSHPLVVGLFVFFGMLNGMGRDRGAALILEQAALPGTTTDQQRTRVIAGYTLLQDAGHAVGALLAGLPSLLSGPTLSTDTHRLTLAATVLLVGPALLLYSRLSSNFDGPAWTARKPLSPASRVILTRISALFSLDSLGGGFLTTALLSYFFFEQFGVSEGTIGLLFFAARLLNAVSHIGAAWLSKRIGLVNTMVFTHIPSSLLLVTVAIAPNFEVAAVLFLLREGLVEMDVPTRQSYVMAVVAAEERTIASGITNLVRVAAWAVAPAFAGWLMGGVSLFVPLVMGASLKIIYDILLWRAFRKLKPPEEQTAAA